MRRLYFTLIELLVVVAIIGVLASMLLPALKKARDSSRKTVCASQVKQLTMAGLMYAGDFDGRFWKGGWDDEFVSAVHLNQSAYASLLDYAGRKPNLFVCPLIEQAESSWGVDFPYLDSSGGTPIGWKTGYSFCVGYTKYEDNMAACFDWFRECAKTARAAPSFALVADWNQTSASWSIFAHGKGAKALKFAGDIPVQSSATGGHVGRLDGAVEWKKVNEFSKKQADGGIKFYW